MNTFRVWAPKVAEVELALNGSRYSMNPRDNGWWELRVQSAKPGDCYAFYVNGEGPFPDPRSPSQPFGVHGPSQLIDHSAFSWTDEKWNQPPLASAIIYELHVGTFTPGGTFEAAIERLDYLKDLGVTHLELMPVGEFIGDRNWGYDGVDIYAPHHAYGGPQGLKRLVNACHERALAVLLDVVYNHVGPHGNYLEKFGPYFTDRYSVPWGKALNFDGPFSDEVRRFFIDNALMWLRDYHFDGLRLDAVHAIFDSSATHFLEELSAEVERLSAALGRHLILIAESDLNDPHVVTRPEVGGYGIHAQWNDDFHHALHAVITGERSGYYADFGSLACIAKALTEGFVYDGTYSFYRKRRHGRPIGSVPGYRLVGYFQNHDQVGNRANGERASALASIRRLKIAAALVATAPFVPMLFQGEEWGATTPFLFFTDHRDPVLAQGVRSGRAREFAAFGWKEEEEIPDPQAETTFLRSKLDWSELTVGWHAELLAWWKALIRLRKNTPALLDGRADKVRAVFDEEGQWMLIEREPVSVAVNLSPETRRVQLASGDEYQLILASNKAVETTPGAVKLPSDSVAILSRA